MLRRFARFLLATCLAPLALAAQDEVDASQHGLLRYFAAHDYVHAEQACRQLLASNPDDGSMAYNLACALAREGRSTDAIAALTQAAEHGFTDSDHALADEDLACVRLERGFQAAIATMREHPAYANVPCEPLHDLPGAQVVERTPSAGMRYRLYIGAAASAADPARLMVWLHPSGGSDDDRVLTMLGPDIIAHGWALMIFPQKPYDGWDQDGLNRMQGCVADAYREQRIDRRQAVPLTYSAGGQLALEIWFQQPDYWSALVLDAAYPIDYRSGQPRPLSPRQIASRLPVLAIVGARDPSGAPWERDAVQWNAAGVPTTLISVPDAGHQFLYTGATWTRTLAWLDDLKRTQGRADAGHAASRAAQGDDPTGRLSR
jgi:pimeloyl-ACP methyl ester carboxylesterase